MTLAYRDLIVAILPRLEAASLSERADIFVSAVMEVGGTYPLRTATEPVPSTARVDLFGIGGEGCEAGYAIEDWMRHAQRALVADGSPT